MRLLAPLLSLLLAAQPAAATELKLGSLTFSDELGGVVLRGGSGTGTMADPFVLIEDITEDGPAVLVIRGMRQQFGNTLGTPHLVGFALKKIVTNRTQRDWYDFELELREILNRTSTYEDGLSFGQAGIEPRPFTSDRYAKVQLRDEPLDAVVFSDGLVKPGETVTVTAYVTDFSPTYEFYLLQRRESPSALLAPRAPAEAEVSRSDGSRG
jgi:hypothetical protein